MSVDQKYLISINNICVKQISEVEYSGKEDTLVSSFGFLF